METDVSNANREEPAMTKACQKDREQLNSLLRGELAAVETYEQAIPKFEDDATMQALTRFASGAAQRLPESQLRDAATVQALTRIAGDHRTSSSMLRDSILSIGGEPDKSSGVWGSFAKTVTGAAKILGPQTVLAALREGEEHGIVEYDKAINNAELSSDCLTMIRGDLLTLCQKHLPVLNQHIDSLKA